MLNHLIKNVIAVAGVASITLSVQTVQADCSTNADTILQASSAVAGSLPAVGPVVGVGLSLGGFFGCGNDAKPLDVKTVVGLIRSELDSQAFNEIEDNVEDIADSITLLSNTLATDPLLADANLESLNPIQASSINIRIESIIGDINNAENSFLSPMIAQNDTRETYDLTPALVLANYKLGLAKLSTAISHQEHYAILAQQVSRGILNDIKEFKSESNRLREMTISIDDKNERSKASATIRFKRNGTLILKESFSCQKIDPTVSQSCNGGSMRDRANVFKLRKVSELLGALDKQDAQMALIQSKAEAILQDPYVDLATVTGRPETHVLLGNLQQGALNRCIYSKNGQLGSDGELTEGKTRVLSCDPISSRQTWVLKESGHIRSSIANLCLEATRVDDNVVTRECSDGNLGQVWTRHNNQLTVQIDGGTRCLSSTSNKLIHDQCDNAHRQRWLAFSSFENGFPSLKQSLGFGPFSTVAAELLGEEVEQEIVDDLRLCVFTGEINEDSGSREPELGKCNRFDSNALWAQDTDGRFRPLLIRNQVLDGYMVGNSMVLTQEKGPGSIFSRFGTADNVFVLTSQTDELNSVFPDTQEEGSKLITGFFNSVERPGDSLAWQHFNGGKFADVE